MTGATLGIDLGTSGVRASVLNLSRIGPGTSPGTEVTHAAPIARADRDDPHALRHALAAVLHRHDLTQVRALAVAGTSGTLLGLDRAGTPIGRLSLYDATASATSRAAISAHAPPGSIARSTTAPAARALDLLAHTGATRLLHEADWVAGLLCGRFDTTDANNALKTGHDPQEQGWPAWLAAAGLPPATLPRIVPPGTPIAPVASAAARTFGLPADAVVAAGTTDGCASFLATGAGIGEGVSVLGSTLTLKLLVDAPVMLAAHGVYSHRLAGHWLAGGASNSGGAVLAAHFSPAALRSLSARIDPARPSGLDYYPLLRPGERFPVDDPALPPRLLPRPDDDARFLHGMLEGIARIEAQGYRLLSTHGATPLRRVLSVGSGAANPTFTAIRARILDLPVSTASASSAAIGAALLARQAIGAAPASINS